MNSIEIDRDLYEYYHYDIGDIHCRHPRGNNIIVPHPNKDRKFQLLKEFSIFGNPDSFPEGKHIGDLFNGILSLVSFKKKFNLLDEPIYISTPENRYDIVDFFSNAKCIPVTTEIFVDVHVNSLARKNGTTLYDYFHVLELNQDEIFDDFSFSSEDILDEITEEDIIIFPITSEDFILDYNLFLDIINEKEIKYRKIFWNTEPNKIYRKNYANNMETINLEIDVLLKTIKEKNPTIIGHRSGIFDLIFNLIPESKTYCVYSKKSPIQMEWRFKSDFPNHYEVYRDYIEKRKNFNEIFV